MSCRGASTKLEASSSTNGHHSRSRSRISFQLGNLLLLAGPGALAGQALDSCLRVAGQASSAFPFASFLSRGKLCQRAALACLLHLAALLDFCFLLLGVSARLRLHLVNDNLPRSSGFTSFEPQGKELVLHLALTEVGSRPGPGAVGASLWFDFKLFRDDMVAANLQHLITKEIDNDQ